ncbi:MAG: hypothetical protein WCJ52_11920 [Phenylobacterium sp.]|jgi:hypothetical protein|uniref:hypothetical protein n=1 Tax=Phenylobacterium sp. TaxID=1871053 RepID=UPI00301A3813
MSIALWLAAAITTVCLEPSGSLSPVICTAPASRLDARRDVCECPSGRRTEAPVCAAGEKPPPETRALNAFRRKAAEDGSLAGDRFQDRPLCVIPTARPARRP